MRDDGAEKLVDCLDGRGGQVGEHGAGVEHDADFVHR